MRSDTGAGEDPEAGAISLFVITLAVMLLMLGGLVFDAGSAMNQRAKAADDAEQAARAGAQQIDLAALRDNGTITLDPTAAAAAADAYLRGLGYPAGSYSVPQVTGDSVSIQVSTTYQTQILKAIDIKTIPVTASATARAAAGIETEINPP